MGVGVIALRACRKLFEMGVRYFYRVRIHLGVTVILIMHSEPWA
jgi:hypothetical protein